MQNTRLNNLADTLINQLRQVFRNPWRRLALVVISLLFGIYLGSAIAAVSGQLGYWDITVAAIVALFTEAVSWIFYSGRWNFKRSILGEALNALKIGVIYGLFIIAFILGS
jgi:CHASE2 domain-containing sensor protein